MSETAEFDNYDNHPWDFIAEEMAARGWSMDDLAGRMGWNTIEEWQIDRLTLDLIETIRDPRARIGEPTIQKLAMAFGVSAELLRNLEAAWLSRPDLEAVCAMYKAEVDAGLDPSKASWHSPMTPNPGTQEAIAVSEMVERDGTMVHLDYRAGTWIGHLALLQSGGQIECVFDRSRGEDFYNRFGNKRVSVRGRVVKGDSERPERIEVWSISTAIQEKEV